MAVRLTQPRSDKLLPIAGIKLGVTEAHIKKPGRKDLLVIILDASTTLAAIFTKNKFCAAPVTVARNHLSCDLPIRALVINTGNANAGTGISGVAHAEQTCEALAGLLSCATQQILPFSTGVIMEPLPVEKIIQGLPGCLNDLDPNNWLTAATAIMTTDTVAKAVSKQINLNGVVVNITGIAKGSGMIHPNMATMLGFIATDAPVSQGLLPEILQRAARVSFNAITVDGDTSTNDACVLLATGKAAIPEIKTAEGEAFNLLQEAISDVATLLAQAIVRDGEGATKFISVIVEGGKSHDECQTVAYAIAHSPLVKTAFFASDPNLGRILAAIGNAPLHDLDVQNIEVYLGEVLVAEKGGRALDYDEKAALTVMQEEDIDIRVLLNRGAVSATFWTCDLSYDYVKINAEYRS